MDIEIVEVPQDPELLEVKVNSLTWRIISKRLFINRLNKVRECSSTYELKEYIEKTEEEGAFKLVLRLLSRKGYFSSELRSKLTERGFPSLPTEKALSRCIERGYINDAAHWERVVESEVRKGRGPRFISAKLRKRDPKISQYLELNEIDQKASIESLLPKLSKKYDLKTREGKAKFFQALQRRGFDSDAIFSCLRDQFSEVKVKE